MLLYLSEEKPRPNHLPSRVVTYNCYILPWSVCCLCKGLKRRGPLVCSSGCSHFSGCDCHPGAHHVQRVGEHGSGGAGQRTSQEPRERRQSSETNKTIIWSKEQCKLFICTDSKTRESTATLQPLCCFELNANSSTPTHSQRQC